MVNYQTLIRHSTSYECMEKIIKKIFSNMSTNLVKDLIAFYSLSQSPLIPGVDDLNLITLSPSRTSCYFQSRMFWRMHG